ncbi:MAG: cysteine peptidase family C39 domain-containing protein [Bacilli bacterium]
MRYYINQIMEKDCGFASLKMLFSLTSKNTNYLYIPQETRDKAYSFYDLLKIGNKYDFKLTCYHIGEKNDLKKLLKTPFIASISDNNTHHAVVIQKIVMNKLTVYDPKLGIYKMKIEQFLNIWDGNCIVVLKRPTKKYASFEKKIYRKCYRITNIILQIMSSIFLIVGFFFIDEKFHFATPIAFFAAAIISEILQKFMINKFFANFDDILISELKSREQNDISSNLQEIVQYKMSSSFKYSSLIINFISSISISVLLIINNATNLYFVLGIFLLKLFDLLIYKPVIENVKKEIRNKELKIQNNNDAFANYKELGTLSTKLISILNIKKYLAYFVILVLSFVSMAIFNKLSINYLLFQCLMLWFIYDALSNIEGYRNSLYEHRKLTAKIVSLIYKN